MPYECGYAFGITDIETEFRVTHTQEGFHILPSLRRVRVHEWLIFLVIFYASPVYILYSLLSFL